MVLARAANPYRELVRPGSAAARFDIRVDAPMVTRLLARGEQVSDEMFLEAIGWFDPPLLEGEMLSIAARELNPSADRGGRPRTRSISLMDVADLVENSGRKDVPPAFASALAIRLRTRESLPERVRGQPHTKLFRKLERRTMMRILYGKFMAALECPGEFVEVEHLGRFSVPDESSRSRKAMALTHQVMRGRFACHGYVVPGIEASLNLIARKPPSFYMIDLP